MKIQKLVSYLVENPSVLNQIANGNASLLHVDQVTASIIVEGFQKEDVIRAIIWATAGE
ncbi:competence pheromone ComX [Bacillus pumilus]|uniref:competence pheromone ComX n=1 Tax=Bacillus pumilus TaxID=1408 RepID=UPI001E2E3D31|nr:competence pheromone ComX [Bacillus pumilus]MCC9088695.1 competence pheromone ComX [Bacillus pumilus]